MVPPFLSPSKPFLIGAMRPSFLSSFSPRSGEDVPFLRSKDMLMGTPHFPNLVALMIPSLYFYLQLTPFNKQTLLSIKITLLKSFIFTYKEWKVIHYLAKQKPRNKANLGHRKAKKIVWLKISK